MGDEVYKQRDYERIFLRDLDMVNGDAQTWEQMEVVYKQACT